jgi:hypothetical protein
MTFDYQKAKKWAPLGFILSIAIAALCVWMFVAIALASLNDIRSSAPVVRITSGAFVLPALALMFGSIAPLTVARFFYAHRLAHSLEMIMLWIMLPTVFLIPVFMIGGSFLQRHYMPPLGYYHCDKLSGNPSLLSNDWVRDPAWCVYKKTHEWVREQAAQQGAAK